MSNLRQNDRIFNVRVLVTEKIAESGLAPLREAGHEVDIQLGLTAEQLKESIKGAHALIIRSDTRVTSDVLDAADKLKAIGRAGVGVDNIDISSATQHGVMVINAPESNITSAAEHAIALMFSLARKIPDAHRDLIGGQWNRSKYSGVEIQGKNIGIIGLGHVGVLVAERLAVFGANVIAYDPYVSPERAEKLGVTMYSSLEELFAASDLISIHLPKTPDTMGLINLDLLKHSQPNLLLVNAARGGIVVEADLVEALRNGYIAGAGIDVFDSEPATECALFDPTLNVVVTPHLGASTPEAQDRAGIDIGKQILLALNDEFVPFALNLNAKGANAVVAPFISVAECCGRIAAGLAVNGITDIEVEAQGKIAEHDCSMLTLAALTGMLRNTVEVPVSLVNAPDVAKSRGIAIKDSRDTYSGGYLSRVVVVVKTKDAQFSVTGTALRRNGEVRITQIDNYAMDVPRANNFVVVRNDDRPGMVGAVGSTLGASNVNIDNMALGHDELVKDSIMVITTDEAVSDSVITELNGIDGIHYARNISLI